MAFAKKTAPQPPKSLYRPENQIVLGILRGLRERTGMNQTEFAAKLGRSQTYVSAAERGSRLDPLQIRDWCHACDTDLIGWATEIEQALGGRRAVKRKSQK